MPNAQEVSTQLRGTWIILAAAALSALGLYLQFTVYINHDVGWVVHSAGWMLQGKVFGRDIIAANPPLIWFLSLPPALVATAAGISEVLSLRIYVVALDVLCLALTWQALKPLRQRGADIERAVIIAAAAFFLFVVPGRDFAQREYLAFALGLPYVVLVTWRADDGAPPTRGFAIFAGVLAGLGFGLKPYFLLAPMGLEAALLWRVRNWRSVLRPETVALALTLVLYLVTVVAFTPAYLTKVVPNVRDIYWGFENQTVGALAWRVALSVVLLGFVQAIRLPPRLARYKNALSICAVAFLASYFIQGKGYSYHIFPAAAFVGTAFALAVSHLIVEGLRPHAQRRGGKTALLSAAVVTLVIATGVKAWDVIEWYDESNVTTGSYGRLVGSLINCIDRFTRKGDYFYAFSTHPFPGFPIADYVSAEWGSRTNSELAVPAIVKFDRGEVPIASNRFRQAEAYFRNIVVDDFVKNRPRVVFVNDKPPRHGIGDLPFDDIAYYRQDPRFAAAWAHYHEVAPIEDIRVFLREPADETDGTPAGR
jgi:hypothetical protein